MTIATPKVDVMTQPSVETKDVQNSEVPWKAPLFLLIGYLCFLALMPLIQASLGVWIEGTPLHYALRAEQFENYGMKHLAMTDYEYALRTWKPRYREKPPTAWQFNLARIYHQRDQTERVDELLQRLGWDKSTLNEPCIPIQRIPGQTIRGPNHD